MSVELTLASTDTEVLNAMMVMRDSLKVFFSSSTDTEDIWTWSDLHLLPNHTYKYKAYRLNNSNIPLDSSDQLVVTTMDTSGHNFTWQTYSIGGIGTVIEDVAILNDTCIVAVGEIYLNSDEWLYNVARWNGREWKLDPHANVPFRAVLAFSDTDMWMGSSAPYHWNGTSYQGFNVGLFNGDINKFWGSSSKDLYIVGTNGAIAHFDGLNWKPVNSGTTLDFQDIWGSKNERTGELEIMAVAADMIHNTDRKIFALSGTTAKTLSDSGIISRYWGLPPPLLGVWFVPGRKYYAVGSDGLFSNRWPYDARYHWSTDDDYYSEQIEYKIAIRGNDINDFAVLCDDGTIPHFNGSTWRKFDPLIEGTYFRIAMRGNMIVAVGTNYGAAGVIAIGRR